MNLVGLRDELHKLWREWRSAFLVATALALAATTIAAFSHWRNATTANITIQALHARRDIEVDVGARPELLLARIAFLARRGEIDRVRVLLDALDRAGDADTRARGHYLLANGLLRKALDQIESSELEAANPFVNLAKREYRRALQLHPDYWDAKYNLDVAARLVRDFPDFERKTGDELSSDPKKLWTDIPGKPKGLP